MRCHSDGFTKTVRTFCFHGYYYYYHEVLGDIVKVIVQEDDKRGMRMMIRKINPLEKIDMKKQDVDKINGITL